MGIKFDGGKPQLSFIPWDVLIGAAKVFETAAREKYAKDNWRGGMPYSQVVDALNRHVNIKWFDGLEENDPEWGLHHLDHALCCLLMLRWFTLHRPDLDDRWDHETIPEVPDRSKPLTDVKGVVITDPLSADDAEALAEKLSEAALSARQLELKEAQKAYWAGTVAHETDLGPDLGVTTEAVNDRSTSDPSWTCYIRVGGDGGKIEWISMDHAMNLIDVYTDTFNNGFYGEIATKYDKEEKGTRFTVWDHDQQEIATIWLQ